MPWKDGYTISDERGVADADVRWPDDATCCFSITVALGPTCGPIGITARDLDTPENYYGLHGGLDALRETLARHGMRATFAVPGVIAVLYPEIVRSLHADGHEIAAHGWCHEDVSTLDRAEERERIRHTVAVLKEATGEQPAGWYCLPRAGDKYAVGAISPHTVPLLLEEGFDYLGNSPADDVPHYWVADPAGPVAMLAMPYYYPFDDQFYLLFPARGTGLEHADALDRNWRAEFAEQYRRGRAFTMNLHPHAIAWPNRLRRLDAFLEHTAAHPGLWNATAGQCAQHWLDTYPAESTLRLEPSIWQHHEDSLN
ncbi:polysaccharide deacetylase family protein [Actinomadura madurae]|uniref:polysaccharide deacetylase family protein n=2 Tax=Actinomadura madurae TaxID=1993 RepID=UPI002025D6EC|nr:polysaccharide deacetylase family protein [Actinomadura madurae]MCP9984952.1 polysaccharide deacetylase family protein [Actinomadura madurae]MCQ0003489.1 polysaccharide deacetylase family protein [Actinomadura madurae]URN01154.1 polysaccharide deacetylase family protein [Actinomadura madurae]URN03293.1 polysaccharide deacetylase family protein [Actinomadura madurae]